ncbi:XRN 5'-3' exonuclease N-terminus-domain-containing protein [Mrakia frigida]|uniref:ssRNA exonuclease RAT1 n=1 Tax=Mrakia frigida TaxID=29902 RepID=UPI003FCC08AE
MGVPALFRWLSKQYPKIVKRVEEEDPVQIPSDEDPEVMVNIPIDITGKNPNGTEFDNLYLDMNGIVHPCTHPEGKPAPETEEEMMLEIFEYTERVVAMVRPRKLLFMAIDGVAPRAKMNQQRSRRFRASQEAADKEREKEEAIAMFASMGHPVSEETKNAKAWDSNAITPGTPFMDLLAASLRYWVVQKMNTDAAWKNIQVIISDASVPGEGEHKIMDFIRRQRTNPDHNPNTEHVIYGLDADLIMLALATHEPHFKVLREDVFFQPNGGAGCRKCGELGHMAAQCTGAAPKPVVKSNKPLSETKPFIFLDVAVLREYLEVFLDVPGTPFPFDLERAIDDWVFLIFFVGNDFLPHLPSLEIREGAIDTLIRIWKAELPRMGGYVTNHGRIELARAEVILEGLAKSEDDIFRKRRESEARQEDSQKRRKVEEARRAGNAPPRERDTGGQDSRSNLVGMQLNGETLVQVTPSKIVDVKAVHSSLPSRPAFDLVSAEDAAKAAAAAEADKAKGVKALAGSNNDVVANRRAIRMANMSAAEMLKAELGGVAGEPVDEDVSIEEVKEIAEEKEEDTEMSSNDAVPKPVEDETATAASAPDAAAFDAAFDAAFPPPSSDASEASRGVKRKADEDEDAIDGDLDVEDEDEAPPVAELTSIPHMDRPVEKSTARTVNADGTVEYEDTVKLWEPGYQERYYREKFGVELSDKAFRRQLATHYVEGLSWVLHYYYQGTPSWQWYYPYHYAPFAADFTEVTTMDISFTLGAPFKPFEQLMGVFPAASKIHIPEIFHDLMTDEMSPIIDFYPSDFDIDMNGKKMQWQGVALLPFIDPTRLLKEMTPRYSELSEDDTRRNTWGNDVLFVADDHPLYDSFCKLYTKKKSSQKVPIDTRLSGGIAGFVLHDPACIPGSTYYSPLPTTNLGDVYDDHSLSVLYYFPEQLSPHRSVMLKGVNRAKRILNQQDLDRTRRGGNDTRGRGGGGMGGPGMGGGGRGRGSPHSSYGGTPDRSYNNSPMGYGGGGGRGGGGPSQNAYNGQSRGAGGRDSYGSQQQQGGNGGGYGGGAYGGGGGPPSQQSYSHAPQSYSTPQRGGYAPPPPTLPVQQPYGGYGGYGGQGGQSYPPPPPQNYPPPQQQHQQQGYGNYSRDNGPPQQYNNGPPPQQQQQQYGQPPQQQQQQGGYQGYGGGGNQNQGGGGRGGYDNSRGGRGGGRY